MQELANVAPFVPGTVPGTVAIEVIRYSARLAPLQMNHGSCRRHRRLRNLSGLSRYHPPLP